MSICRGCGARITWAKTHGSNASVPLDRDPVENGNVYVDGDRDGIPVVRYVKKNEPPPADVPRYRTHFVTCPKANEFRRDRKKARST